MLCRVDGWFDSSIKKKGVGVEAITGSETFIIHRLGHVLELSIGRHALPPNPRELVSNRSLILKKTFLISAPSLVKVAFSSTAATFHTPSPQSITTKPHFLSFIFSKYFLSLNDSGTGEDDSSFRYLGATGEKC